MVNLGIFLFYFRWCECLVGAIVEVTYVVTMTAMRRIYQLVWPVGSPLGTEASPSFELVVYGPMGEVSRQPILDSTARLGSPEPVYEEVEDSHMDHYTELEDEGVCMDEGEDNRLAFWEWVHDYEDERFEEDDITWEEEISEVDLNEAILPDEVWE